MYCRRVVYFQAFACLIASLNEINNSIQIQKVSSIYDDGRDIQVTFEDVQYGRAYLKQETNRFQCSKVYFGTL